MAEKFTYKLSSSIILVEYANDPLRSIRGQINNIIFDKDFKILNMLCDIEKILTKRQWNVRIVYSENCKKRSGYFTLYVYEEREYIIYENTEYLRDYGGRDFAEDAFYYLLSESYENYLKKKTPSECAEEITKKYTSTASGYIDYNRISLCKEYLENDVKYTMEAYKKLKEEENMPTIKSTFDPFYFNPSDFGVPDYYATQEFKGKVRHQQIRSMELLLGIQNVKFQDPATIVFWDDGTKTVVKCQKGDKYDPEKGLAMAIIKKKVGKNNGYFNKIFEKWCPDEETEETKTSERPKVFTETAEEYAKEVKKQKKIGDGYDDIRWESNGRIVRK